LFLFTQHYFSTLILHNQAYRTILTHFSQRYPRCPEGLDDSIDVPLLRHRPLIAFDGLFVLFSLLPVIPLVGPAVAEVLSAKEEEADAAASAEQNNKTRSI
jgi:hypothetical protein